MAFREDLHEALDRKDFPSPALLARTMSRLDEPKPSPDYRWPASLVAGLLAITLVATFVVIRASHQAPTHSGPILPPASTISGLVSYQFVSTQVGWLRVYTPGGETVVASTSDGGKTWRKQLELSSLSPVATIQFVNAHDGWLFGTVNARTQSIWRTVDAGATWPAVQLPSDAGLVSSGHFVDSQHGWMLTTGNYQGSVPTTTGVVYETVDGGQTWHRQATIDAGQAILSQIAFANQTSGVITTYKASGGISLYQTQDGGRTWSMHELAAPPGLSAAVVATMQPPVFFSDGGLLLVTLGQVVVQPCPSTSPAETSPAQVCHAYQPTGRYLYETSDGGATWSGPQQISASGSLTFVGRQSWVLLTTGGLSVTNNGGKTWSTPRPIPVPSGWYRNQSQFLDLARGWLGLSDSAGNTHIAVGPGGIQDTPPKFALLVTDDGGLTWHEVSLPSL